MPPTERRRSGSQETDGKPDTPETTVPQQEETDESLDTGAVQPTGEQDAPVAEPADTEETVEQNIVREEFGYLIVGKRTHYQFFVLSLFEGNCRIILNGVLYCLCCLEQRIGIDRRGKNL